MIKTHKEKLLSEREEQRNLRSIHGMPSISLAMEFLSLPYWARHALGSLRLNSSIHIWKFDEELLDRSPHDVHEVRPIDFYDHTRYVLTSFISKPINWRVVRSRSFETNVLSFPCNHEFVIKLIFELIADMEMEVTAFGVSKERGHVYISLDDKFTMEDSFDDEYQAIIKIYKFVWELHNEVMCPSLSDLDGQFDIIHDDRGNNIIELYDIISIGGFLQKYEIFARRGTLIPRSMVRSFQNYSLLKGKELNPVDIGKVTLLEGDFLFRFVPKGP